MAQSEANAFQLYLKIFYYFDEKNSFHEKKYFDEKYFGNTDCVYKTSKKSMPSAFVHYSLVARMHARHVEQSGCNYCSKSEN